MSEERRGRRARLHAVPEPASEPASSPGSDPGAAPDRSGRRGADDASALADLLVRTGRGDAAAFERLYDRLAGAVHGLAVRIVRDPQIAEDVAQEALVEVWRQAARYRPGAGSARSWVLTIAHRRAVDRVRAEQAHSDRLRVHGPRHAAAVEDPEVVVDAMHSQWQAARVRRGLQALTEIQREALELTYYKGYTNREVADSLGIPLGTAKARIRDAVIRLRDAWEVDA